MNPIIRRLSNIGALACLLLVAGSAGCATSRNVVRTPHYTLAHPPHWKVKTVATKLGEQTTLSIGRPAVMAMSQGSAGGGAAGGPLADVDVRIVAWPDLDAGTVDPSEKVGQLLRSNTELQLAKHERLAPAAQECGRPLAATFTVFGRAQAPLELRQQPGWRTVVIGGRTEGVLVGVVARVPFEQEGERFCRDRDNLRAQLQSVLAGLEFSYPRRDVLPEE